MEAIVDLTERLVKRQVSSPATLQDFTRDEPARSWKERTAKVMAEPPADQRKSFQPPTGDSSRPAKRRARLSPLWVRLVTEAFRLSR